jgi:hypothetical protein
VRLLNQLLQPGDEPYAFYIVECSSFVRRSLPYTTAHIVALADPAARRILPLFAKTSSFLALSIFNNASTTPARLMARLRRFHLDPEL